MDVPEVPTSAVLVGAAGAFLTGVQLYMRFSERRPLRASVGCAALFISICVVSGVVAGVVSLIPLNGVGVLGLAVTVPFAAPNPTQADQSTPTNSRARAGRVRAGGIAAVVDGVWRLLGKMTERLDARLTAARVRKVHRVETEIAAVPSALADDPLRRYERVHRLLEEIVDGLTGEEKKVRKGQLRAAYDQCKDNPAPLRPLLSFAYDLGQEDFVLELVQYAEENPPPHTEPPPPRQRRQTRSNS